MGAAPSYPSAPTAAPTVYLAGDSTMAPGGGGAGTNGWGEYLKYSMNIPVVNKAIAGRSARSYTREGRFDALHDLVKKGDYVIIELGHNDGSTPLVNDNGRSDCPGSGDEVCQVTYDGVPETVLTFPAYITNATDLLTAAGATVILSSQTPNNPDETGTWTYSPSRFVGYQQQVATATDNVYVDHGNYCAQAYKKLPVATVDAMFPNDHTHTAPAGADLVSKAFVRGLVCGTSTLKQYVKNATASIDGVCL